MKYVADLSHVQETTLAGATSLDYWRMRLAGEDLVPIEGADGEAQMLVVGADAAFKGLRFREVSFSVLARRGRVAGAFLIQAYNSRRFFAFVERVRFHTPYAYADVTVSPSSIEVPGVFRAEMRKPRRGTKGTDAWEDLPVWLPKGRHFFARIEGEVERIPFANDGIDVRLEPLVGSNFVPREWCIRRDARHAKSKTTK